MITEISFPAADGSLTIYGNLTLPFNDSANGKSVPAILVVNGSGPIDRNGNVPSMKMNFNTCNRFAEHISTRTAERSIAVLSYDKRGVGKSIKKQDKNIFYRAGMMDMVLDAVEAVRYLSQHPRIDKMRIVVLGHSEGAIIMPLICHEVSRSGLDPIFGCIFYAGFGENLKDAMILQRKRCLEEVREMKGAYGWILRRLVTKEGMEKQYNDMMEKVNADEQPDYISTHFGLIKQPAKWMREHFSYDVTSSLQKYVTCHCLAITGMKDVQVRSEFCDPQKAGELVPNATSIETHRPENLTHALRSLEGPSKLMNIKRDYTIMGKFPLDDKLLSITDQWCDRVLFGTELDRS
ncbi:hypothetical protein HJC23_000597 [Cyclotella cryptica]|uniref:Serine aminopeptidase S33 domain-containing protein n=1 Tax=Cyclotella cryptica TaxID=29204 RepID=A0ABD3PE05_9STRA